MYIRIIAVGTKMPAWVVEGFNEYVKRLPADFAVEIKEIPLSQRGKNIDIEKAKLKEAKQILEAIPQGDHVIALEVKGKNWSTEKLAEQAGHWRMQGYNVCLLIGGPDGLADVCKQRADQQWSLSPLTLPHPLVRIMLAEQLYRAWSILNNHPYHRAG